jgi:F0F1-type ATP synthase assembly protein I
MDRKSAGSSLGEAYRKAGPYLSLGVEFTASILVCLFAGRWLDAKLGTTPYLLLAGTMLGAAAGFIHFFRAVLQIQNGKKPADRTKPGGTGKPA